MAICMINWNSKILYVVLSLLTVDWILVRSNVHGHWACCCFCIHSIHSCFCPRRLPRLKGAYCYEMAWISCTFMVCIQRCPLFQLHCTRHNFRVSFYNLASTTQHIFRRCVYIYNTVVAHFLVPWLVIVHCNPSSSLGIVDWAQLWFCSRFSFSLTIYTAMPRRNWCYV